MRIEARKSLFGARAFAVKPVLGVHWGEGSVGRKPTYTWESGAEATGSSIFVGVGRPQAGESKPGFCWMKTTVSVSRCQIDHRSSHTATQPSDRTGKSPFSRATEASSLAAMPVRCELPAASPHFCVAFLPSWPIEIWYGEELTEWW